MPIRIPWIAALVALISVLFSSPAEASGGPWHVYNNQNQHTQKLEASYTVAHTYQVQNNSKSNAVDVVVRDSNGGEVSRTQVNAASSSSIQVPAGDTLWIEARENGSGGWFEALGTYSQTT